MVSTNLNLDKFTRNSKIKNLIKIHESARHDPSNQCDEHWESRVHKELKQSGQAPNHSNQLKESRESNDHEESSHLNFFKNENGFDQGNQSNHSL